MFVHLNLTPQPSIGYFERPQGIVILTRTPIQDKVRDSATAFGGLKHGNFVERIMAESLCHKVRRWLAIDANITSAAENSKVKLFICHQSNYSSCYEITDWMHALPDYNKIDQVKGCLCDTNPDHPKTDDNDLRRLYNQAVPRYSDDEAFCRIREDYFIPLKKTSRMSHLFRLFAFFAGAFNRLLAPFRDAAYQNKLSVLPVSYVTMRGRRDFSRLLEVAIRAAFAQGCRDVLVLNPHALDLTENCLNDAMWALSAQRPHIKNQVVLGRSQQGGCYLLGVTYQQKTVLHLRKLTSGVDWTNANAYDVICDNLSKLGWSGVSLRVHHNEFIGLRDLHLIPTHLGFPMNFFLNEYFTVIVPTKDCEDYIMETLDSIVQNASRCRPLQIIVMDAHSKDDTLNKVRIFQKNLCSTVQSAPPIFPCDVQDDVSMVKDRLRRAASHGGQDWSVSIEIRLLPTGHEQHRGEQVHYAIEHFAKGSCLLILYPGTLLPLHWDSTALRCLNRLGVVMGAFSYHLFLRDKYIERKNISWALRCFLLDSLINLRSTRFEMPLGTQAFFMFTYYYHLLGEYPRSVLMDDVEMVERAHCGGHVGISQSTVTVWPHRALNYGFLRTALLDNLLLWAYKLGAKPESLAPYYNKMTVISPEYLDGY